MKIILNHEWNYFTPVCKVSTQPWNYLTIPYYLTHINISRCKQTVLTGKQFLKIRRVHALTTQSIPIGKIHNLRYTNTDLINLNKTKHPFDARFYPINYNVINIEMCAIMPSVHTCNHCNIIKHSAKGWIENFKNEDCL